MVKFICQTTNYTQVIHRMRLSDMSYFLLTDDKLKIEIVLKINDSLTKAAKFIHTNLNSEIIIASKCIPTNSSSYNHVFEEKIDEIEFKNLHIVKQLICKKQNIFFVSINTNHS